MNDPDQSSNVAAAIRSASRIIAASLVIVAGGIAVGPGGIHPDSSVPTTGEVTGIVLVLAGALVFLIEYVVSHRSGNPPPPRA